MSEVVTVAVSWADDPVAGPDWTTTVAVVLVPRPTVNGSQVLVQPAATALIAPSDTPSE